MSIPKIIHYVWVGGKPLNTLAKKCIASWKKYLPDYEIKRWDETTFDIKAAPLYVRQAYEAKKWAFVSDYIRLWALENYGGIYMDTDVEVIKSLDQFLEYDAFIGFESKNQIQTGLMASSKDFPVFSDLLNEYESLQFIKDDGTYDLTPNVTRITEYCIKHGFIQNNELQSIDKLIIFPKEYFCPLSIDSPETDFTENTCTIHHFSGSWCDHVTRFVGKWNMGLKTKLEKIFGPKLSIIIYKIIYNLMRLLDKIKH